MTPLGYVCAVLSGGWQGRPGPWHLAAQALLLGRGARCLLNLGRVCSQHVLGLPRLVPKLNYCSTG